MSDYAQIVKVKHPPQVSERKHIELEMRREREERGEVRRFVRVRLMDR